MCYSNPLHVITPKSSKQTMSTEGVVREGNNSKAIKMGGELKAQRNGALERVLGLSPRSGALALHLNLRAHAAPVNNLHSDILCPK